MKRFARVRDAGCRLWGGAGGRARAWIAHAQAKLSCSRGQGTTEYAILVGVQTKQDSALDNKPPSKSSLSVSIHTKLDNVLAKKREIGGLPCFR